MSWQEKFRKFAGDFNPFVLGNSAMLYYLLIFFFVPVLAFLSPFLRVTFTEYQANYLALFYLLLGLTALVLGYWNGLSVSFAHRIPNVFKKEWDYEKVKIGVVVLLIASVALKLLRIWGGAYFHTGKSASFVASPFYSLVGLFDWLGYALLIIAFGVYFTLKKNNDVTHKEWQRYAWGIFALEMAYAAPSCSRMSVVTPIVLYFLVQSLVLQRVNWKQFAFATFASAFLIFPLGNICRNPDVFSAYRAAQRPLPQTSETATNVAAGSDFILGSFFGRVDQSRLFAKVVEHTDELLYGRSLMNFFISLGPPRFIWKSKPVINGNGNEFGRAIGILAPGDYGTSVGPTIVGDWYMNFGLAGIVAGMFFMGMLFRFIYEYALRASLFSLSGVLVYSASWIHVIKGFEDWIAPVYAGLFKLLVILLVIHYLLIKRPQ